jgi:hypothetical protein
MQPMRRHVTASLAATFAVLTMAVASPTFAAEPTAPPPSPSLESADTAPPGAAPAATVQPIGPPASAETVAPAPAATVTAAATVADPGLTPVPPAARPKPFYRRSWFWGTVGVVLLTGAIIGILSLQPTDPATPSTKLGDMRAF